MKPQDIDELIGTLVDFEGCETQMYLDTRANVTVGIGELVPNSNYAVAMGFERGDGTHATAAEVIAEFERVRSMGQTIPASRASHYRVVPANVLLPTETCLERCRERVEDWFIPGLIGLLVDFESYPGDVQIALCDIVWNTGIEGLSKFKRLLHLCQDRNWYKAAFECHRAGGTQRRNDWTMNKFLTVAKEAA